MTTHETAQRYPLTWPTGWKRTNTGDRSRANFGKSQSWLGNEKADGTRDKHSRKAPLTTVDATKRLQGELDRLGAIKAILSTNVETRLDGTPRADRRDPSDVGAAVYFELLGKPLCLACDKWDRVADNIAALAQHIDALRRIERYGVGRLEQAFAGYAQLPAKGETQGGDWRAEMGFQPTDTPITLEVVEARYRALLKQRHPDQGGSHDAVVRLNLARDAARAYFKG